MSFLVHLIAYRAGRSDLREVKKLIPKRYVRYFAMTSRSPSPEAPDTHMKLAEGSSPRAVSKEKPSDAEDLGELLVQCDVCFKQVPKADCLLIVLKFFVYW